MWKESIDEGHGNDAARAAESLMRRGPTFPWSPPERAVAARFARALVRGRYRSARQAAPELRQELAQLRRRVPDGPWPKKPRSLNAAAQSIARETRAIGFQLPTSRWTPLEAEVAERFARALVAGRYQSPAQAARSCRRALAGLRRRFPSGNWLAAWRSYPGILHRILERAAQLGRGKTRAHWTRAELRILDAYARGVVKGRFQDCEQAARSCLAEWSGQLRQHPGRIHVRSLDRIVDRVREQVTALGRRLSDPAWTEPELRLLDRYVRKVIEGKHRSALKAAPAYLRGLARLRRRHPEQARLLHVRTISGIQQKLCLRAQELGRSRWWTDWSPSEERAVSACARRVMTGEFRELRPAVNACYRKLAARRSPKQRARTRTGIRGKLLRVLHEAGWGPSGGRWIALDLDVIRRYAQAVSSGRLGGIDVAARKCREELNRARSQVKRFDRNETRTLPASFKAVRTVLKYHLPRRRQVAAGKSNPKALKGAKEKSRGRGWSHPSVATFSELSWRSS